MQQVADGIHGTQPTFHIGHHKLRHAHAAEVVGGFEHIRYGAGNQGEQSAGVDFLRHHIPCLRLVEVGQGRVDGVVRRGGRPHRLDIHQGFQAAFGNGFLGQEQRISELAVVIFDLHQYLPAPEQAVRLNGLAEHIAHVQPLVAFLNLLDGLAIVFFAYGFDFYPLAGHFVGGGFAHAAVFGNLRQLGQARIADKAGAEKTISPEVS